MNGKAVFSALALVISGCAATQATEAQHRPIRQVDHIMIRVADPRELYAFFTEVLELPVAWPLVSPRAGVTTGGVSFGNVNVEAIRFPEQTDEGPRLLGLALEPAGLGETLAELDRREITYGEPRPLISATPNGSRTTLWTNVTLLQFSDAESPAVGRLHVFISEYSPNYVNVDQRRARLQSQLHDRGGGPLGIVAVKEVVIGVSDFEASRRLWRRLLGSESSPGLWRVGDGPALRLARATADELQALVVAVTSLSRSTSFLRERGLLGSESTNSATIDPARIGGLDIRLVETVR